MSRTWTVLILVIVSRCLLAAPAPAPDGAGLYRIEENGKWGFIDSTGRMVIPATYDDSFYEFSEGLAAVQVGKKWGYIDAVGRMVIAPQFDGACSFKGGLAAVHVGEFEKGKGKWGYIDKSGRYVLKPHDDFSYLGFDSDRMPVENNGKRGYIDRTGRQVIPAIFGTAAPFSEGLAWVESDTVIGFIDPQGKLVIPLANASDGYAGFCEGLAMVTDRRTSKIGFVNKQGTYVISPMLDEARSFSEGRAAVCVIEEDATGWPIRKWGAIDTEGHLVVPAKFDFMGEFSGGLARVEMNKKYGFIDRDGKEVIACQFDSAERFDRGLARVNIGGYDKLGWWGSIDKTGRYVWKPADFQARDAARKAEAERPPTIRLLTDPQSNEKGLLVTCERQVAITGPHAGEVNIRVWNYLEEEVFLAVTGYESLGCTLESKDGSSYGGGGSFSLIDNIALLKRLHASVYKDEKRFTCGCACGWINGKLSPDVLSIGAARGTVDVILSGFYRKNGKAFCESVKLPIELVFEVKGPKPGQATTRPTTLPSESHVRR